MTKISYPQLRDTSLTAHFPSCRGATNRSGTTKTPQTVTLQVEMLLFFLCWEISAQVVNKKMVGKCVLIFYDFLLALNFHRLQCFSCARIEVLYLIFDPQLPVATPRSTDTVLAERRKGNTSMREDARTRIHAPKSTQAVRHASRKTRRWNGDPRR